MNGRERRQHPRISISAEIDFRSENNFYSGRTRDISLGGLFLELDVALPIGTRIMLDLRFLQQHLQVDAEVMWVLVGNTKGEPVGVGVRFVDLSDAAKKSIEAFMVLRTPIAFGVIEADDDEKGAPEAS